MVSASGLRRVLGALVVVALTCVMTAGAISSPYTRAPTWATYLEPGPPNPMTIAGSAVEDMAIDPSGNIYLAGVTTKSSYSPAVWGPHSSPLGGQDGFLAVLNPAGSSLLYFTFLGGSGFEWDVDLALLPNGDAAVVMNTLSTNTLPSPAYYTTNAGAEEIYIALLKPLTAPTSLQESYFGSWDHELHPEIAYNEQIPANPQIAVAGFTSSPSLPDGSGGFVAACQYTRAFVSSWSTTLLHLGTVFVDYPTAPGAPCTTAPKPPGTLVSSANLRGLVVDSSGGLATAMSVPCAPHTCVASVRLSSSGAYTGTSIVVGPGTASDVATLASSPLGSSTLVIVGTTDGAPPAYPLTGPQPTYGGGPSDAFVSIDDTSAMGPWSYTYAGGTGADEGYAVAIDSSFGIYAGGTTRSNNFPLLDDGVHSYQPAPKCAPVGACAREGWYQKFGGMSPFLTHSTYIGGTSNDQVDALTHRGRLHGAGLTASFDVPPFQYTSMTDGFPTTMGSYAPEGDHDPSGWAARLG